MFWSLLLEPGKRYTKVVDSPFHISAAVLDTTTHDQGIVRVIVDIGDTEAHIANLSLKLGILQFPLDLQIESGSRISFYTTGARCNVHLSGYVLFDMEETPSDEEDDISEEEEEEDIPTLVTSPVKRKPEDNVAATANKKAKVQKVATATPNNTAPTAAKAAAAKASPAKPAKANAVLNKVMEEEMDSDEDDDGDEEEDELDDSDEGEEEEEEDDEDDESEDDDDEEEEEEEEDEDGMDDLANLKQALKANAVKANQLPNKDQINMFKFEKTPKGAKTPKGEKQTPKGAATPGDGAKTPKGAEGGKTPKGAKTPASEGAKTPKGAKTPGGEGGKTPKGAKTPGGDSGAPDKSKKTPKQQGVPTQNGKTPKSGTPAAKDQAKSPQTPKTVKPGGVVCEDLVVGKGPEAKGGKMVSVYYEGRLVSNKKMFDKCDSGKGFKFRLGGGEVIKGWDVGVSGMRIGGKRKITCPPHMAYGKKGAPPDIPGNAALSFVVELKGIS